MDEYTFVNGKKLKKGYTTGACAASETKAAVSMLFTGEKCKEEKNDTPIGKELTLKVHDIKVDEDICSCSVIKDGGDDPDVTHGLKIFAYAKPINSSIIEIKAGIGIGIVTLEGLRVPVGSPAINPIPMQMIKNEIYKVLPEGRGVEVTISVPKGEEVAKKTFNPRLGIIGGISILGTTGIVNPMSEEALKDSLTIQLDILAAKGVKEVVYAFGNFGEDFIKNELKIDLSCVIKVSNYIGFMLEQASIKGFKKVMVIGHIGKLVKVAAGIFQTHSRVADARMEILTAYAAIEGADTKISKSIYNCITTTAAIKIIKSNGLERVFEVIAENVSKRCSQYTYNSLEFGTILFGDENILLAMDSSAKKILGR